MARQLKACIAIAKDQMFPTPTLGSCYSNSRKSDALFWTPGAPVLTCKYPQTDTHTQFKNDKNLFLNNII